MNNPTRRRILFIAEAVSLAHVTRPLVLAGSLNEEQYEIHFSCSDAYSALLTDLPGRFWPIFTISPEQFMEALAKGRPIYDRSVLERYLQEDLRLLDEVRPDVVVGDFRLSLAVSAVLRKVPYVNIVNAHWSPFYIKKRAPFPEHPLGGLVGPAIAGALFRWVEPLVFLIHAEALNGLRKRSGLPRLGSLRDAYTQADLVLYPDTPGLLPCSELPENHHYLGPILWAPPSPLPEWWNGIPKDRRVVYVTLGSSGAVEILPQLLGVLGDLPVSVILATAGRVRPGPAPDNVYVSDYVPGLEAAGRSTLVVCNGGSATAYQALACGTPVLGLPTNMDQFFTQEAIVDKGAGALIRPSEVDNQRLRYTLESLLSGEQYHAAAQAIAKEFAEFKAVERFASILNSQVCG